jgi:hypothetical protein
LTGRGGGVIFGGGMFLHPPMGIESGTRQQVPDFFIFGKNGGLYEDCIVRHYRAGEGVMLDIGTITMASGDEGSLGNFIVVMVIVALIMCILDTDKRTRNIEKQLKALCDKFEVKVPKDGECE